MPPKKPPDGSGNVIKMTKSNIVRQHENELKVLAEEYKDEDLKKEDALKTLTRPLTRCNSLPVIYRHKLVKELFLRSKSVDVGFEPPIPPADNDTLVIDDLPDETIEEMNNIKKITPPPRGPTKAPDYSKNIDIDDKDLKAIDNLEDVDHVSFMKTRVGEKKLEDILDALDPLGEPEKSATSIVDEEKALRRRVIVCLLLPVLLAIALWIVLILQMDFSTEEIHVFERESVPPVDRNAKPFEYLPPPRSISRVIPLLAGFVYCDKSAPGINQNLDILPPNSSSAYSSISKYYLDKMRYSVASLSNSPSVQGSFVMQSMEISLEKIKLEVLLLPRYHQVSPGLLWLGVDFSASMQEIKKQLVLLANEFIFEEMTRLYSVQCTLQEKDVIDRYVTAFIDVGKLSNQFFKKGKPNKLAHSFEGYIARRLIEVLATESTTSTTPGITTETTTSTTQKSTTETTTTQGVTTKTITTTRALTTTL